MICTDTGVFVQNYHTAAELLTDEKIAQETLAEATAFITSQSAELSLDWGRKPRPQHDTLFCLQGNHPPQVVSLA